MDRDRELHEMVDEGRALMSDYIKREDALELFEMVLEFYKDSGLQNIKTMVAIAPQEFHLSEDDEIADFNFELDGWRNDFMKIESADVVEVVRCKDCFLYGECQAAKFYGDNGYCSCGERRKDE